MKKKLILVLGVFLLNSCGINHNNFVENNKEIINEKFEPYFVKTQYFENFKSYTGGFEGDLRKITLNKLEIVDVKTNLNGLKIFSEDDISKIKVKILPCTEMPLKIGKYQKILSNCFEVNPGTKYDFGKYLTIEYPDNLFKGLKDENFGINHDKDDNIKVYLYKHRDLRKSDHGNFYSGESIDKYNGVIQSNISYLNGFYYIGIENKKLIKNDFGEEIGYFKGPIYKKSGKIYLGDKKLDLVDGSSFRHIEENFVADNNGVYFIDIECNYIHGRCTGIKKINKIRKIKVIESPKTFKIIKRGSLAKDEFNAYTIGYKGEIKKIEGIGNNFRPIKRVENVQISGGNIGKNTTSFFSDLNKKELVQILKKYPENNYKIKINYKETEYNKDDKNIYYGIKKIEGADYETFEVISYQVGIDKKSIYLRGRFIFNKLGELEILYKGGGSYVIAKDEVSIYNLYSGKKIEGIDAKTFEYLNKIYAKDKNNVYLGVKKIENADVETFTILYDKKYEEYKSSQYDRYAKDKNNAYYNGKIINGVDLDTFEYVDRYKAKDKFNTYSDGKIITIKK